MLRRAPLLLPLLSYLHRFYTYRIVQFPIRGQQGNRAGIAATKESFDGLKLESEGRRLPYTDGLRLRRHRNDSGELGRDDIIRLILSGIPDHDRQGSLACSLVICQCGGGDCPKVS